MATKQRSSLKLDCEALERREVPAGRITLADGVVMVRGTGASDKVLVREAGNRLVVRLGGSRAESKAFRLGSVTQVLFTGSKGADMFLSLSGVPVRALGGSGNDVLSGGPEADFLDGGVGDDVLNGGGGDDSIYGGLGEDELFGEFGNDWLYGGEGGDELMGGIGNDRMDGGEGRDVNRGGGGDDTPIDWWGDEWLDFPGYPGGPILLPPPPPIYVPPYVPWDPLPPYDPWSDPYSPSPPSSWDDPLPPTIPYPF